MMNVNKRDLRKISYDFRILVSRILNANYKEISSIIAMFIAYIERTPLLIEYIQSCPLIVSNEEMEQDIKAVAASYGQEMLSTGKTPEEEIAYIFELLKKVQEDPQALLHIGYGYCNSKHFQDWAKAFGNNIVLPFANHINAYLTHLSIDMGMDDNVLFNITVNGGQVNLSQDNSTLHAIQNNNGIDIGRMQNLIDAITESMKENAVSLELRNTILETLEVIKEEMSKPTQKKSVVTLLLNGLKSSATVLGAVPEVSRKINEFAAYIAPFIS